MIYIDLTEGNRVIECDFNCHLYRLFMLTIVRCLNIKKSSKLFSASN